MADKQTRHERSVQTSVAIDVIDQFVDVVTITALLVLFQISINTDIPGGLVGPGSPLRVGLILVILLVLPGYALTTLLFPTAPIETSNNRHWFASPLSDRLPSAPGLSERLLLSFGLSLAMIPLAGLGLSLVNLEYTTQNVGNIATVAVFVPLLLGSIRRLQTPAANRYTVSLRYTSSHLREGLLGDSRTDTGLNLAIALGIITAIVITGVAVTSPQNGSAYTEFSLLTENEQGALVTDEYPSELTAGEPQSLIFQVNNQEGVATSYEVVVLLERTDDSGAVVERSELDRFEHTTDQGNWLREHEVVPTMTGDNLRLTYLLYKGDAPAEPQQETAYRSLYIWVSVES